MASAPLDNANGDTQSGSVHRFSAPFTSSSLIPVDPSPNSNRKSGEVMAREGALLVSTIARTGGGHDLILHNLTNNTPLLTIPSEELSLFKKVTSLGLASGRLLVGIPSDATLTTDAGAVFLIQTLPQPETFSTLLSKGDSAPGYPGISFNAIGDACLTPNGAAITRSTLSGPGSNRGKDTGLYSNVGHPGWFDSLVKSRDSYDSYLFGTIQNAPIANDPTFCLFQSTLTTPGVASANNRVLMRDNGSSTIDLMNTGSPIIGVPGVLKQIRQVSQSHSAAQFAINLNSRSSTPGLTLPNDSSILIRSNTGNPPTEIIAEGQTVPMQSFKIGELSPRTSFHSDCLHFSAALTEDVTTLNNTAVFSKKPGSPLTILARKGDPTPDLAATYSTFLAEGGTLARPFLRATVKGSGISTSNDDCLFFHNGAQLKLVARERQNAFVFGKNITWLRFRNVWPVGDRLLVHATVAPSTKLSAAYDALFLYQENQTWAELAAKGATFAGSKGELIAAFQRIEVSASSGHYTILASLSRATSTTNQILLRGDVNAGSPSLSAGLMRRPSAVFQKGSSFSAPYLGATRLTSLTPANLSTTDPSGLGRKGLSSVISSNGTTLLRATFSDGSARLITLP
jgi:hypothetical protein